MPRFLLQALLLVLITLGSPAGAEPIEHTYLFQMDGRNIGNERFTVEDHGDTLTLQGFTHFDQPVIRDMSVRPQPPGSAL